VTYVNEDKSTESYQLIAGYGNESLLFTAAKAVNDVMKEDGFECGRVGKI
jgi:hypothetical protein